MSKKDKKQNINTDKGITNISNSSPGQDIIQKSTAFPPTKRSSIIVGVCFHNCKDVQTDSAYIFKESPLQVTDTLLETNTEACLAQHDLLVVRL